MSNNIVIITGASGGIGGATAKLLGSKGATIALAARREEKLRQVAAEIQASGGKASVHQVDVTDKGQVTSLVDDVVRRYGRLDVMINNAGLMAIAPLSIAPRPNAPSVTAPPSTTPPSVVPSSIAKCCSIFATRSARY